MSLAWPLVAAYAISVAAWIISKTFMSLKSQHALRGTITEMHDSFDAIRKEHENTIASLLKTEDGLSELRGRITKLELGKLRGA